uniref:Uncharacterized protein n=1 Tax=Eptatretus burgeri TaxID=7764 RepID=A0A8C4Q843_EPTBU
MERRANKFLMLVAIAMFLYFVVPSFLGMNDPELKNGWRSDFKNVEPDVLISDTDMKERFSRIYLMDSDSHQNFLQKSPMRLNSPRVVVPLVRKSMDLELEVPQQIIMGDSHLHRGTPSLIHTTIVQTPKSFNLPQADQRMFNGLDSVREVLRAFTGFSRSTLGSSQDSVWTSCKPDQDNRSPWFVKRFDNSAQPVLPFSQAISLEDFNWWKSLQLRSATYHAFRGVLALLKQKLSSNRVFFKEKTKDNCIRCAVVGNSHILRGSGFGRTIDCHDYVFRMNRAPVRGFERDVGSTTTHYFIYPESTTSVIQGSGLVFIPFKLSDLHWLYPRDIGK